MGGAETQRGKILKKAGPVDRLDNHRAGNGVDDPDGKLAEARYRREVHEKRVAEHYAGIVDVYLMAPVLAGMCSMHELNTVLTLDDLVDMNHALQMRNDLTDVD